MAITRQMPFFCLHLSTYPKGQSSKYHLRPDPWTPWRTQGADLYSTGASGAAPVRPVNAVNAAESVDKLGEGRTVREPEKPSAPDTENRDWTRPEEVKQKEVVEEPPKEPISKQLIEFIQSMWRASAQAVEQAQKEKTMPKML